MALPKVDLSTWPVLLVEMPAELSLSDVDSHFDELVAIARTRRAHVHLVDGSELGPTALSPTHRKRMGERLQSLTRELEGRRVAEAIVLPNPLLRGVMTAIHWIAPPKWPVQTFATRADALTWCQEQLAANGMPTREPAPAIDRRSRPSAS
ncbi:hypothetical protein [Sandaracinus amylolyticus]|uniref:STAS/SEC14 domain-containing protein n=1 Tax=Sandaracinus amylolyticus TaxID=927083 RepID=A0A0F6YMT1_9BACT|nr:hypothetical protein [Sandaracinus amylolyticus]AKF11703.1 hypothetical protein DB32_008852 [Sandaracinus amylolyticus]